MHRLAPALAALLVAACAPAAAKEPALPPAPAPAPVAPPRFIEDDLPGATAKARAEGKVLFVDAWAPWCHSCLSMKHFVLSDPSLGALADRVVFASIDIDRPAAAPFLERHPLEAWPTFFVLDPATDRVLGFWVGSASLGEIRGLLEEGAGALRGPAADPVARAFAEARAAHAAGDLGRAAQSYERAVSAAPPGWANRSAALVGWIAALSGAKAHARCVEVGTKHLGELRGSSAPADFASYLLTCAEKLPAGAEKTAARAAAVARLRDFTAHPPAEASVDDRADALDILSEGLADQGDHEGAKKAQEARLALMEQAARSAPSAEIAQTFDYGRANAYVALGRAAEAVAMLEKREREMPDSYEPPARLAGVLFKVGRLPEALSAIDRALAHAYGPRKLRYLKLRGDIQAKLGDRAGALASLKQEVAGYEALAPGQARPEALADARRRLGEAEKSGR